MCNLPAEHQNQPVFYKQLTVTEIIFTNTQRETSV